jgi:hypothetical protein
MIKTQARLACQNIPRMGISSLVDSVARRSAFFSDERQPSVDVRSAAHSRSGLCEQNTRLAPGSGGCPATGAGGGASPRAAAMCLARSQSHWTRHQRPVSCQSRKCGRGGSAVGPLFGRVQARLWISGQAEVSPQSKGRSLIPDIFRPDCVIQPPSTLQIVLHDADAPKRQIRRARGCCSRCLRCISIFVLFPRAEGEEKDSRLQRNVPRVVAMRRSPGFGRISTVRQWLIYCSHRKLLVSLQCS